MHIADADPVSATVSPWEGLRPPASPPPRPWAIVLSAVFLYAVAVDAVLLCSALGGDGARLRLGLAIALGLAVAGRSIWVFTRGEPSAPRQCLTIGGAEPL